MCVWCVHVCGVRMCVVCACMCVVCACVWCVHVCGVCMCVWCVHVCGVRMCVVCACMCVVCACVWCVHACEPLSCLKLSTWCTNNGIFDMFYFKAWKLGALNPEEQQLPMTRDCLPSANLLLIAFVLCASGSCRVYAPYKYSFYIILQTHVVNLRLQRVGQLGQLVQSLHLLGQGL